MPAGEVEEDVVEGRALDRDLRRRGRLRRRGARASAADVRGAAVGRQLDGRAAVGEAQLHRRAADPRLQLLGGAPGDDPAAVEHRDRVGQSVGLLEVLGGEEDRHAFARPGARRCPRALRGCAGRGRSSARRGRGAAAARPCPSPGRAAAASRPSRSRRAGRRRRRGRRRRAARRCGRRAARPGRRRSRAIRSRFSRPVSTSSTAANWPVRLIDRFTPIGSASRSWPATVAEPESGRVSVARMRTIVVLPAPLGPSRPKTEPRLDRAGRRRRARGGRRRTW